MEGRRGGGEGGGVRVGLTMGSPLRVLYRNKNEGTNGARREGDEKDLQGCCWEEVRGRRRGGEGE